MKQLVIVESPTKARTIRKFLGPNYVVESCMGHVRDLPQSAKDVPEKYKKKSWSRLGVDIENCFDPIYCVPTSKKKVITHLRKQLESVDMLILATDEDREGESIGWHLKEVLKPKVEIKRMVFHEITKQAISESLENFRDIDIDLVKAQESRRILDRLVGYTLSPLLWKKISYGLSAGRVQSVAVKLISDKEIERLNFKPSAFHTIQCDVSFKKQDIKADLIEYKGQVPAIAKDFDDKGKLKKSDKKKVAFSNQLAQEVSQVIGSQNWVVHEIEKKKLHRTPPEPFITSTLQQAASTRLKIGVKEVMNIAQKLYDQGFITYMRTDSRALSQQAVKASREQVKQLFGNKYLSEASKDYSDKKSSSEQGAHEAIRPAGNKFVHPEETKLKGVQLALYQLIWKRTLASQMASSVHNQVRVVLTLGDCKSVVRGYTTEFLGFLIVYGKETAGTEVTLPDFKKQDSLQNLKTNVQKNETKPPHRYTEASLVKSMEKEGIGRPSTYATVIDTVLSRGYAHKLSGSLVPTLTALIVSELLTRYLSEYINVKFTSEMEKSLDLIAQGKLVSDEYLSSLYLGDKGLKKVVENKESEIDPKECKTFLIPKFKGYEFKVGKYGQYVCYEHEGQMVSATLPNDFLPGNAKKEDVDKIIQTKINGTDSLGQDPETQKPVFVLSGKYGPYVQLGDFDESKPKEKLKRVSLPPNLSLEDVSLEVALQLLSLPKSLGIHPESQKELTKNIGRFGPYVQHDGEFRSIPKSESVLSFDLEQAIELFKKPKRSRILKSLGEWQGATVSVYNGKYGPYVKWKKVSASLPEGVEAESCTVEQAQSLLEAKLSGNGKLSKKKGVRKKAKRGLKSDVQSDDSQVVPSVPKKVIVRKKQEMKTN